MLPGTYIESFTGNFFADMGSKQKPSLVIECLQNRESFGSSSYRVVDKGSDLPRTRWTDSLDGPLIIRTPGIPAIDYDRDLHTWKSLESCGYIDPKQFSRACWKLRQRVG